MIVKKFKEKQVKGVNPDDLVRKIDIIDEKVIITIRDRKFECLWFGFICSDKYFFRNGDKVQTNILADELKTLKILFHPTGKVAFEIGDEKHVLRSDDDVEAEEKVLIFLARRTCAEYLAVDGAIGCYIIAGFSDQRNMNQALTLHQMLWKCFAPTVQLDMNVLGAKEGEIDEEEQNQIK